MPRFAGSAHVSWLTPPKIAAIVSAVIFAVLAGFLFRYQIIMGADFEEESKKNYVIKVPLKAARGEIVDALRYGEIGLQNGLRPASVGKADEVVPDTVFVDGVIRPHLEAVGKEALDVIRHPRVVMEGKGVVVRHVRRPLHGRVFSPCPSIDHVGGVEAEPQDLTVVESIPAVVPARYRFGE